jgi:hypothetical protein
MAHHDWKSGKTERPMVIFDPSTYYLSVTTLMQRISLCIFIHMAARLEADGTVDWKTSDIALEMDRSPRLIRRGLSELQKYDFIARKNRSRSRWMVNPSVVKPSLLSY